MCFLSKVLGWPQVLPPQGWGVDTGGRCRAPAPRPASGCPLGGPDPRFRARDPKIPRSEHCLGLGSVASGGTPISNEGLMMD